MATVTVALCATSTHAVADDGSDEIERTADLVAQVAPDQGELVIGQAINGGGVMTETYATTVLIPEDPTLPMIIEGGEDDALPLAVSLPAELSLDSGRVADDGTVVYAGADGTSAAVQVLDNGATRVQTIIDHVDAPTQFTYSFDDGVVPRQVHDGLIELAVMVDGTDLGVGTVGQAWAVDADGAAVPTRYELEGTALVQHVEVDETTAFPVVADPLLTYGVGVYMNLTGSEWKVVAAAVVGATVGVVTAACLGAKLPAGWAKAIGAACTLIGVNTGIAAFVSALRSIHNMNLTYGACYQIKLGTSGGLTNVDARNCA